MIPEVGELQVWLTPEAAAPFLKDSIFCVLASSKTVFPQGKVTPVVPGFSDKDTHLGNEYIPLCPGSKQEC